MCKIDSNKEFNDIKFKNEVYGYICQDCFDFYFPEKEIECELYEGIQKYKLEG